jgi:nucleotide-binding universal stress UspA family protein
MHVLLATDGSQQSLKAARFLGALVNPAAIERITVIAVIRPLAAVPFAHELEGEQAAGGTEAFALSFRREAQAAAERVAAELRGKAPRVDTVVRSGSPADEIIRAADEVEADLIVVGGRGKGAVGAILMGSVAHRVLHHALCPVLVTR